MNRRGFIAALAAFASTAVLDPERALWVRGAKTISVPAKAQEYLLEFNGQEWFMLYGADGSPTPDVVYYTERLVDGRSAGIRSSVRNGSVMADYLHTPHEQWQAMYPQLAYDMRLPRRSMVADRLPLWR